MNNTELVQSYRQQIGNVVNQANLQLFWNMYNRCGRPLGQGPPLQSPRGGDREATCAPSVDDEQAVEPGGAPSWGLKGRGVLDLGQGLAEWEHWGRQQHSRPQGHRGLVLTSVKWREVR